LNFDDGKKFSYSNIEITFCQSLLKKKRRNLKLKKEVSSQDSLNVNEEENREEQLTRRKF
jgi:hypothetical protein